MAQGYGDRLARGGVRASFGMSDGKTTQEKWDEAFKNYVPASEKKATATTDVTTPETETSEDIT